MPTNHLILCHPLLLLLSIFPSIRVLSNESVLHIRWLKYWSFSFGISPSNEYSGLISFRMDLLDLLAVQGTLKSLLQQESEELTVPLSQALWWLPQMHEFLAPHNASWSRSHHFPILQMGTLKPPKSDATCPSYGAEWIPSYTLIPSSSPHLFVIFLGSCARVLLAKCGVLMQKEPIRNQSILLELCTKEAKFSFLAELPRRQEKSKSDAELHPWPGQGCGRDGSLLK